MLTFLKKLGQIIVSVAGISTGIGPLIVPFLGSGKAGTVASTGINDLTAIGQLVVLIEASYPADGAGAQKLQALIPLVANVIKTSELVSGKKIANEALFTKAAAGYAQATVDLLNSIHPDAAQHAA